MDEIKILTLTLGADWRLVLRKAWSVRFMALSFAFNAIGIILSALGSFADSLVWSIALQLVGLVFITAAFIARIVKQKAVT